MKYYGKRERRLEPRRELTGIQDLPADDDRLLLLSEVLQGILDERQARDSADDWQGLQQACSRTLIAAARGDSLAVPLARLRTFELPDVVVSRSPEGPSWYGLSPAGYARTAARLRARASPPERWKVIGLRSAGVAMGAAAAVSLQAPLFTLRPVGPPGARRLRVTRRLERAVLDPYSLYAIVDEGPGISGSSVACVAQWLESHGVAANRIYLLPGHEGPPGPEASTRIRQLWDRGRAEGRILPSPPEIPSELLRGEALHGGRWRVRLAAGREIPVHAQQERLKFLVNSPGGPVLWKLCGFGTLGRRALVLARNLSDAGLTPPLVDLRPGWLASRWIEGMDLRTSSLSKSDWLDWVAGYLAHRAALVSPDPGASVTDLLDMALFNLTRTLSPRIPAEWIEARLRSAARRVPPPAFVLTDSRMHAWEWRIDRSGRITKCDAIDHHAAHDCIGPQDLSWDIAGAEIEGRLTRAESDRLLVRLSLRRVTIPSEIQLEFYRIAYAAFQLGACAIARRSCAASSPDDAGLLKRESLRYRSFAERWLTECTRESFSSQTGAVRA